MKNEEGRHWAAVGFAIKSGWAATVLLAGPATTPRVLDVRRLDLSDPAVPEARQPYHAGFGAARSSGAELSRLVASVGEFGRRSVVGLIRLYEDQGFNLAGAGIVAGSLGDPERIANAHIRIHALEGRLFREVVEAAVRQRGLQSSTWRERDIYEQAAGTLGRSVGDVRGAIAALERPAPGPWRAEHKAAALAASLVLAAPVAAAMKRSRVVDGFPL